jgi:hypothetical protein
MSAVKIASLAASTALASLLLSSPVGWSATPAPSNMQLSSNVPASLQQQLSAQQRAQLQQIFAATDAKIRTGIHGQDAQAQAMQAELRAIGAIRDPAQKHQAIRAYQAKYTGAYQAILRRAGVDLAALPNQLNAVAPSLQFQLRPDLTLVGRSQTGTSAPANVLSGPRTTTTKIASSAYDDHKHRSCLVIAGGDVTFGNTSVTNSVVSAADGGCFNDGDKTANITIPAAAMSAHLDASADLSGECFAVGVLAGAACQAYADLEVWDGNSRLDDARAGITVYAPFLWAASDDDAKEPGRVSADLRPGKTYTLRARTETNAVTVGIVTETHGNSHISHLDASLTITQ